MEIAIIGLPKSGATTVFNALTGGRDQRAGSTATAGKPTRGVAKVPDHRLAALEEMFHPKRTVPAEVQYVDIPGDPQGLGRVQGMAGELLNIVQQADALLHVVRAFEDPTVPHVEQTISPYRDVSTMDIELAFADLGILERRLQRIQTSLKGAKGHERDLLFQEQDLLDTLKASLEENLPVRDQQIPPEAHTSLANYQLLTAKPLMVVFNLGEDQLQQTAQLEEEMEQRLTRPGVGCATLCGKLEMELSQMMPTEEREFREALSISESGLNRMIRLSHNVLGLVSFFTTVSDEVKAWTVPAGTEAVKAAGKIHSDMERGFIRAEVAAFDDLQRCGGMAAARKQGLLRREGKNYPVKDGDVITFLFNV